MANNKITITGLTRQKEREFQQKTAARIEAKYKKLLQVEIQQTMTHASESMDIFKSHARNLDKILTALYRQTFDVFGKRILSVTLKSRGGFETKSESDYDTAARKWVEKTTAKKVTEIAGTTKAQARRVIKNATQDALDEGLSSVETGAAIRTALGAAGAGLSVSRAQTIARTETHAAAAAANLEAAAATGLALRKVWAGGGDARTRDAHDDADGQEVGLDEDFNVGGEAMAMPLDPSASAENVINCRCVLTFVAS